MMLSRFLSIKKTTRVVGLICIAFVILGFIPFEKEVSMPEHESSTTYAGAYDYKSYVNQTNTSCLNDAWSMSNGDREIYDKEAAKCASIPTGKYLRYLKLNNGPCNARVDHVAGMVVEDCETFYINNGSLYELSSVERSGDDYEVSYDRKVKVEIISGSSARVDTYYTVTCRGFGLLCANAEYFGKDTHIRSKLVIGEDFIIEQYNGICNGYSGIPLKEEDLCIYADAKSHKTTIKSILEDDDYE